MSERVLLYGYLTILALVPLPLASVPNWAWSLAATSIGVLLLTWSALTAAGTTVALSNRTTRPFLIIFGVVVAWETFQISTLSPMTFHHPLWLEASSALDTTLRGAISLDPDKGVTSLLKISTYAGVFWLAAQLGRSPEIAKKIIVVVACASTAYAVYGLIAYFSGTMTILWYRKWAYWEELTSTFVNKNNYATYAGLGWLCVIALFYHGYSNAVQGVSLASERIRHTISFIEKSGWRHILATLVLLGALLYSHSRAGFTSTLIGVVVFCLALALNKTTDRKFIRRFAAIFLVFACLFLAVGGRVMDERLAGTDLGSEERPAVYHLTMIAIGDQPLLGAGPGTFEEVFRFYRTAEILKTFDYAHNTYLEAALELGIPAAATLVAALLIIAGFNVYGARTRRRDEFFPCLGLGATFLVGMHSLLDFSIQIPAVAITYAAITGVCFSQSWSSRRSSAI